MTAPECVLFVMQINPHRDFGARECPSCACEVPANNNHCPMCGYDFPQATSVQKNMRVWGAAVMVVLLVLLILGLLR